MFSHLEPVHWVSSEKNRPADIAIKRAAYEQNLKDAKLAQEACEIKRLASKAKLDAAKDALRETHDPIRTSGFSTCYTDILTIIIGQFFFDNQFLDFQHLRMCSSACAAAGKLIIANPRISSSLFVRFTCSGRSDFGFRHVLRDGDAYLILNPFLEPDVVIIPKLGDHTIVTISMTFREPAYLCNLFLYYRPVRHTFHLFKGHVSAFSLIKGSLTETVQDASLANIPAMLALTNSPTETIQYKALTMGHSPALEVTADDDVEIFWDSELLVDMDPFDRSALLFHGVAFRNERGTIQMKVILNTGLTHPNRFTLRCHCEFDDDNRMRLHLSNNIFAT
jgi:hypothetical protein